ncbi:nucleoside triphosphate pyrophosphohydrolase family protein [Anaeroselena agilis]|uniref:Nucleoside triphosphate pyrophosphohydrolase family protein n=1 Tax=Anaeroselena agilis TaxID=3063788 RepID=A0ABU3NYH6_9FIRM|nr:nucleoside triphosphate pyrophosphohydrolase family protein [Selenomonadales bacterium 4137-cl]
MKPDEEKRNLAIDLLHCEDAIAAATVSKQWRDVVMVIAPHALRRAMDAEVHNRLLLDVAQAAGKHMDRFCGAVFKEKTQRYVDAYCKGCARREMCATLSRCREAGIVLDDKPQINAEAARTMDDYQQLAERTAGNKTEHTRLTNFGMGLAGEAGETIDYLKKVVFHGHQLDKDKLQKELGDCLWYIATLATTAGLSLSDVAAANIEKLRARYPEGFDPARSINRIRDEDC